MTIEQTVLSTLRADSAVAALVNNGDSPQTYRITYGVARKSTAVPYIVFFQVSGIHPPALSGHSTLKNVRMQIDCNAASSGAARTLADAVLNAMEGISSDNIENYFYEVDTELHRFAIDFSVWE